MVSFRSIKTLGGTALVVVVAGVVLSLLGAWVIFKTKCTATVSFTESTRKICVEIADDTDEWILGLADRPSLKEGRGMLFLFPEPLYPMTFTMAGMQFPLDIIFMDTEKRIVDVRKNLPPCPGRKECMNIASSSSSQYVLEVNAGDAESLGISVGSAAEFLLQ